VSAGLALLAFVTLQRAAELVLSARNARQLTACGGVEVGSGHYPFLVGLHAAWLAGLWLFALGRPLHPVPAVLFLALQPARAWVIATLRGRWTTRIIVLPGAPLVRSGPYRFLAHPNYVIVAGEIALLPLAFGLPEYALVFSVLNAVALFVRVRTEARALAASPGAP
jgi:methyltransferase